MKNSLRSTPTPKRLLSGSLVACGLLAGVAGCARTELGDREAAVKEAVQGEAKKAKQSLQTVQSANMQGGALQGGDAQGRPLWRLEAKKIQVKDQSDGDVPNNALLTDARATLYRSGKVEARLEAKQLRLFKNENGIRLLMTGNVKARSEGIATNDKGPVQLEAPRADVDVTKHLIVTSGGVLMTHQKINVKAQTMRGQTALEVVDVAGNIVAQDTSGGQMRAKTAHYDWKGDHLTAQTVSATRGDMNIVGQTLDANTSAQRGTLRGAVTAKNPRGTATAPKIDYDWGRDLIVASSATLTSPDGVLKAGTVRTDSKLRVSQATNLRIEKDGSTLEAREAKGFDKLTKLSGVGVTLHRDDATLTAGRAQSENWSDKNGKIVASGGVSVQNARGSARAEQATWSGGKNGLINASGAVEIRSQGSVLRGNQGQSDTQFQNATLSGNVSAKLANGTTFTAPLLVKTGDQIVAPRGGVGKFPSGGDFGQLTMRAARLESTTSAATARASGGVTITSATGASVQSDEAIYSKATQKITTTGRVTLRDPKRGITQQGDKMVADLRLKQVVIENARGQGNSQLFDGKKLFD